MSVFVYAGQLCSFVCESVSLATSLCVFLSNVLTTADDMQVSCVHLSVWASVYVSLCVFVCALL